MHRSVASQKPLVTAGAKSSMISDTPQDREAGNLRVHQAQEVAAAYGVPPPLVGMMVTEWGQGIAELARMFYRFGAKQHAERFLAPFQVRLLRPGDRFHLDLTDLLRGNTGRDQQAAHGCPGRRAAHADCDADRAAADCRPHRGPGGRVRAAARPAVRYGRSKEGNLTRANGIGAH